MARNSTKKANAGGFGSWIRSLIVGRRADWEGLGLPGTIDYGVVVNQKTALKFTAVFAAVKILSENIASLPKTVTQVTADGDVPADNHPAALLLAKPNSYTDPFTFWFAVLATILTKGNAFCKIDFSPATGRPEQLHILDPDCVQIIVDRGRKTYVYKHPDPEEKWLNGTYLDGEILHFMFFSLDGIAGVDPITYNAASIGRGIATGKFSADFYRKGGQIKGTLETDQSLTEENYQNFLRHYRKSARNFETPILEYGMKYKSIGVTPIAAQLIQSETLSIQDIARMYSVPPHLLADLSHATFSNIEQQNIFFGEYSLRPLCKRLEVQLEDKLISEKDRGLFNIKFDLRGMMRGDASARAAYYASGISNGWMTPNEARQHEGLRKLRGLDNARVPLNYATVTDEGKIINNDTSQNDTET